MNNPIQAALERRRCFAGTFTSIVLVLGALLAWAPLRTSAQVFSITQIPNTSVLVGTPISIQITLTNTTTVNPTQLYWTLTSTLATDATIITNTLGPMGPTTFNWTPTQAQTVTFSVGLSQPSPDLAAATMLFTVTVTNSTPDRQPAVSCAALQHHEHHVRHDARVHGLRD